MLRFFATAGLVLGLTTPVFAQAPPAPPVSNPGTTHGMTGSMTTKNHSMKSHVKSKNKGTLGHKTTMLHGNQMHGTTPNGAPPPHSP